MAASPFGRPVPGVRRGARGHLVALVSWAVLFPASFFADRPVAPLAAGALLHGVIGLLAIRAWSCLADGRLRLTRLQIAGLYALWVVFAAAFTSRAGDSGVHNVLAGTALVAVVLRWSTRSCADEPPRAAELPVLRSRGQPRAARTCGRGVDADGP